MTFCQNSVNERDVDSNTEQAAEPPVMLCGRGDIVTGSWQS